MALLTLMVELNSPGFNSVQEGYTKKLQIYMQKVKYGWANSYLYVDNRICNSSNVLSCSFFFAYSISRIFWLMSNP